MCSYNAINGVPSCGNDWLLNQVARNDWGFDGYITSDCDADADAYNKHHYYPTPEATVAGVLKAGTDVDCTSFVGQNAQSALDKKLIDETLIDARLTNLFKAPQPLTSQTGAHMPHSPFLGGQVRMRLGHFDAPGPLQQFPTSDICSSYAIELSNNGPVQASALLKNINSALPMAETGTIAVIGPNALLSKSDVSYYGPHTPCGAKYNTMVDAVQQHSSAKVAIPAPSPPRPQRTNKSA